MLTFNYEVEFPVLVVVHIIIHVIFISVATIAPLDTVFELVNDSIFAFQLEVESSYLLLHVVHEG